MLIGQKRGLPADALNDFVRTGTSHILAVSGFNVSIFIVWLSGLAAWIGRRRQLVISACCIICFAGISGFSAAVIRASVMGLVLLLSLGWGRLYIPSAAVLGAAACMVLQNPRLLYWDAGFQLSAAATLGIVWGMEATHSLSERVPRVNMVWSVMGVTICALIATTPLSLWHFGQFSVVAVPANLLVLPLVEVIMAIGLLVLVPGVGTGFAFVVSYILLCLRWVVVQCARVPFASVPVSLSGRAALMYMVGVFLCLFLASDDGRNTRGFVAHLCRVWYNTRRTTGKTLKNTNNFQQ